jgi:hypothetical protein
MFFSLFKGRGFEYFHDKTKLFLLIKIGYEAFFPKHFSLPRKNATFLSKVDLGFNRSLFPWVGKKA